MNKPKKSWAEFQISDNPMDSMKIFTTEEEAKKWIDERVALFSASAFGKLGGSVKSKRKARAARKNGAKGGRPRKEPESHGTKIAREVRAQCNNLTQAERDELMKKGIERINKLRKEKK